MHHLDRQAPLTCTQRDLHHTAWIAGRYDAGPRLFDMVHLTFQQGLSHRLIGNVINTGAAAAPVGFRQMHQREPGNGPQ